MRRLLLVLVASAVAGCAPRYRVLSPESASPVLSPECELQLFEQTPEGRAYSILGTIEPEDPSRLTEDAGAFLDAIRSGACTRTANAVIAVRNVEGLYVGGTLIRVR